MPNHKRDGFSLFFCQFQELCCKFTHCAAVGRYVVRDPKAVENGKQRQGVLRRLPLRLCVFDQRTRPIKRHFGVGRAVSLRVHLCVKKGNLELDRFATKRRGSLQRRDLDERARELCFGLDQCRASERTLSRLSLKMRRLLYQTGLSAVSRQKLRLVLRDFRKLAINHFCDAGVQRSAGLAQQSAIGGVLQESVLEKISRGPRARARVPPRPFAPLRPRPLPPGPPSSFPPRTAVCRRRARRCPVEY